MSSSPSASHYQQRARGICALCKEPMPDDADRLHHPECDQLCWCGCRVNELRALTKEQRLTLAKELAKAKREILELAVAKQLAETKEHGV